MAKHQAEDKLIVVRHQPGFKRKLRLAFLTGALIAGALGFLLGGFQIRISHDRAIDSLSQLSGDFTLLKESEAQLSQQVANLESGRTIDNLAKKEIQNTIRSLKSTISQLKKDVTFYQNIMAPSDNARGLQVQKVEIAEGQGENRFGYKIALAQVANNKAYVNGVMAVNLIGLQDGKPKVLPLRDISEVKELGIKFRFKYFQNISGELMFPDGFIPGEVQVVVQSKGKKASRVEQAFAWKQLVSN